MTPKDLGEIRRRLNPDFHNPSVIRGCYVAQDGRIISTFSHPVISMPQEENEKYMALFKRALSGTPGQNLLPIEFSALEARDGEEHQLLMRLRASALKDDEAVDAFFQRAIAALDEMKAAQDAQSVNERQDAGNYLILLLHDAYDVPYKNINGETDAEQSLNVFPYFLCAVCPVKQTKPALSYFAAESEFHSRASDWVVGVPELGFMFPAFEERSANIYQALYYTRDIADVHAPFLRQVFNTGVQMAAGEQQETFQAILQESLGEECSLDVVAAVHETVRERIEEKKADRSAEPLRLSRRDVKEVLTECGVSPEKTQAFEEKYDQAFGAFAQLPAVNIGAPRQFKVSAAGVSVRVSPELSSLVETRMIDGRYYLLVPVDGDVEVNGVSVRMGTHR